MTDKHSAKQNLTLTEPRHINLLYIQVLLFTVEVAIKPKGYDWAQPSENVATITILV